MAIINEVKEVLHKIRVKLYPNHLPNAEGTYIARTTSEASLGIDQVCAALKNRGGFAGNFDTLVENVRQYFDEAAYQLCDGFAVNTGYYSIHPNVGGTFTSPNEDFDPEKHPISFRFRTRLALRRLIEHIGIEVEGVADTMGYIDEFTDIETESVNETATPGGQFIITGQKIKASGDNMLVGVYFVNTQGTEIKVTKRLAENTSAKIIGVIPQLPAGTWKIAIKTQFTYGSYHSKELRQVESGFTISI